VKVKEIYKLAINKGIAADPRGKERIDKELKKQKEIYQKLDKKTKASFDPERLTNPYSDTRILLDNRLNIKRVLVGIDIEVGEMLLADRLSSLGKKIDLVVSHHPLGKALARLDDVMKLQVDLLASLGVPINIAESLLEKKMSEVARKFSPYNHYQAVDAARLLELSVMCVHTPADNLVYQFVKNKVEKANPETVGDLLDVLHEITEYKKATLQGAGPTIFAGNKERRCGKIALTEVTGGTAGHKDIYGRLSQAGVGTIIGMHMGEEHKEEAEKHHINVVIAGHMASDSIGMNLFLDELEKRNIEVVTCSGLIRVKRIRK
jgi:hypothetical protein